jgi:hypothetical protein
MIKRTKAIPPEAFEPIIKELERLPLRQNDYRVKVGKGQSQTFGIVNRRCLPPDYSRLCWKRPELYYHLLEFADKYVDLTYNAITVNQNYQAGKHKDKHNVGDSFLVSFGEFTGGDLLLHETDISGNYDICHKPIVANFSKILHSVAPFQGNRYSLVFYYYKDKRLEDLPEPSVKIIDGKYVFYRGEEKIDKKIGLPHPLTKKKLKEKVENGNGVENILLSPEEGKQAEEVLVPL